MYPYVARITQGNTLVAQTIASTLLMTNSPACSEQQVSDEQKNKGLLFIEKPFFPLNQALLDAALIKRLLIAARVGKVLSVGCGKIVGVGEVLLGAHIEVVVLGGTQDGFDGLL